MKSFFVTLILFLLSIQIEAQERERCPEFCPAVYMPVCGKTNIDGEYVKCEFGNGCMMGVSSCRNSLSK
ncbi:hypothetical protein KR200_007705 [Drosophila serrata]|nr:hypothetical protein KR200_007705 [Drosophila serrata]